MLKCMAQPSASSPRWWWLSKSWQPQHQPRRSNGKESRVHSGMPWRDLSSDKTPISEKYENEIGKFRSPGRGSVFSLDSERTSERTDAYCKIGNNFYVLFLINFSSPGSWDEKKPFKMNRLPTRLAWNSFNYFYSSAVRYLGSWARVQIEQQHNAYLMISK